MSYMLGSHLYSFTQISFFGIEGASIHSSHCTNINQGRKDKANDSIMQDYINHINSGNLSCFQDPTVIWPPSQGKAQILADSTASRQLPIHSTKQPISPWMLRFSTWKFALVLRILRRQPVMPNDIEQSCHNIPWWSQDKPGMALQAAKHVLFLLQKAVVSLGEWDDAEAFRFPWFLVCIWYS